MNVLSLFDWISCGRYALEMAGIGVDKYYASEIDKYAMQISNNNYPNIIQIGDITKVDVSQLDKIDLLIGGSPCQGFSFAGAQLNFDDPRSKLFFEYVKILQEIKIINPDVKFLLENVKMKKEYQGVISDALGVEPIEINSSLLSAQNRKRLYWTNIEGVEQPKDKGLFIKDILHTDSHVLDMVNDKLFMNEKQIAGVMKSNYRDRKPVTIDKKCPTLKVGGDKKRIILPDGRWRYLSSTECERLQTLPDGYTACGVSETQRYKALGNGWTVSVISHILKNLKT